MYEIALDITTEYILDNLSQEQIMERYTNVPIDLTRQFLSPFREDKNPTCSYFYNQTGNLILKDFSGHFTGGCFKVVMYLNQCSYYDALKIIAADFGLIDGTPTVRKDYSHIDRSTKAAASLDLRVREFNQVDKNFWEPFGISKETLQKFLVYPVEILWLNKKPMYSYKHTDPAYAYTLGKGEYKIYFPKRKKMRFLCNTNAIQGAQIPRDHSNGVVITKSMKDVMVLHELGIVSYAPQSESAFLDAEWVEAILQTSPRVVTLYDFDMAGVKMSNYIRHTYNIQPLFLTNGRFNTVNYQGKDISDLVVRWGKDRVRDLIRQVDGNISYRYDS